MLPAAWDDAVAVGQAGRSTYPRRLDRRRGVYLAPSKRRHRPTPLTVNDTEVAEGSKRLRDTRRIRADAHIREGKNAVVDLCAAALPMHSRRRPGIRARYLENSYLYT